jgi:hypothetical protein
MQPIRRVVTGHNSAGKSVFVMDGAPPVFSKPGRGGVTVTELWRNDRVPASNAGNAEATIDPTPLSPPADATLFRIVEYQPDSIRRNSDRAAHAAAMKATEAMDPTARHFGFHKTKTLDYAIVLDGEIYAMMDEGECLLKAGDVLVQRGTNHAWSNRTDKPVRVAFVLIDADPL